jgi:hypothetical protein
MKITTIQKLPSPSYGVTEMILNLTPIEAVFDCECEPNEGNQNIKFQIIFKGLTQFQFIGNHCATERIPCIDHEAIVEIFDSEWNTHAIARQWVRAKRHFALDFLDFGRYDLLAESYDFQIIKD